MRAQTLGTFEDIGALTSEFCLDCHSEDEASGKLDLTRFTDISSVTDYPMTWSKIRARVSAGEMPPPDSGVPRPDDERLTPGVAREVCQRLGLKAMIDGSIARLGSTYVLRLDATDCASGEPLVRCDPVLHVHLTAVHRRDVMEFDALAQLERVLHSVFGYFPGLRKSGHDDVRFGRSRLDARGNGASKLPLVDMLRHVVVLADQLVERPPVTGLRGARGTPSAPAPHGPPQQTPTGGLHGDRPAPLCNGRAVQSARGRMSVRPGWTTFPWRLLRRRISAIAA